MRAWWFLGGALLVVGGVARADILVWRDANGVRHFTNRADTVPADHRPGARVLIPDAPRPDLPEIAVAPAPAPAAPAVVTSDRVAIEDAYRAGLDDGLSARGGGGGGGAAAGGSVDIVGPLAVSSVHVAEADWGPYGWGGGAPWYPFVTTGFDRGRSRHQTLRMLLQEQFQIDRDGPYAYGRWDAPGLGPALAPFLPRGLPVSVRQYGRVIAR